MKFHVQILIAAISIILLSGASSGQNWEAIQPGTNEAPSPRTNAAAIYDSAAHRLIVFGGRTATGDRNDVWAFDFNAERWSELVPQSGPQPAPRRTANAIYDPVGHQMVIWSGDGTTFFNDVWSFDLANNRWTEYMPPAPQPAVRYGAASIYDPVAQALVTFAGFTSSGRFDDTWQFDLAAETWTDITPDDPNPLRRCLHAASYDRREHRMIVYGGQNSGARDDIWAFDLENHQWQELTPATGPDGRWFPAIVYVPANHEVIVFGGNTGSGRVNEVWTFELAGNEWRQLHPTGSAPAAREGATAVYLEREDRMIVFGGRGSAFFNDLWELQDLAPAVAVQDRNDSEQSPPSAFRLSGHYPNPFSISGAVPLTIFYELPRAELISFGIFDLQGRKVRELIAGQQPAGRHAVAWDGKSERGQHVAAGIYFAVMRSDAMMVSRKLAIIRAAR